MTSADNHFDCGLTALRKFVAIFSLLAAMLLQAPAVNGLHFGLDYIGPGRYPVMLIEFIEPSANLRPPAMKG